MGLSSSQARLLHLTSRMHQIEYKAAKLEAEKLQMANESNKVYDDYLAALESQKITVNVLNTDATIAHKDITADMIYNYGNLSSQYALVTKDDKTLISSELHTKYQNTNSLTDFLADLGLNDTYTQTITHSEPNPAYQAAVSNFNREHANWNSKNIAYTQYLNDVNTYNDRLAAWTTKDAAYTKYQEYLVELATYNEYLADKAAYNKYLADQAAYESWEAKNPEYIKGDQEQPWWETGEIDGSLATRFEEVGGYCYNKATNGDPSCYGHILLNIVDFDGVNHKGLTYSTSLGADKKITFSKYGGLTVGNDNATLTEQEQVSRKTFAEVSEVVDTGTKINIPANETFDLNASSSDYEILLSKFNRDGSVKSMKQWIVDLYYITQKKTSVDGYQGDEDFSKTIKDIQKILSGSLVRFKEPVYQQAVTEWENLCPGEPTPVAIPDEVAAPTPVAPVTNPGAKPTVPEAVNEPGAEPQLEDYVGTLNRNIEWDETVTYSTFTDKALTQWFVNVWCKMEGQNETPMVEEIIVHDDATNIDKAIYRVQNINKSFTTYGTNPFSNNIENDNYIVINDDQMNDNSWISKTVQEGMVMLQVWDKMSKSFVDTSVATNTSLNYVDNKIELKKAEAKYEADMLKIDRKDRKYDTDLAAIEAERNAIKQEMDTLKTVAKENVERTFKLFS